MKSSRIADALKNTVQPKIVRVGEFKFIRFNANRICGSPGVHRQEGRLRARIDLPVSRKQRQTP